jgi:hypothetical protein
VGSMIYDCDGWIDDRGMGLGGEIKYEYIYSISMNDITDVPDLPVYSHIKHPPTLPYPP